MEMMMTQQHPKIIPWDNIDKYVGKVIAIEMVMGNGDIITTSLIKLTNATPEKIQGMNLVKTTFYGDIKPRLITYDDRDTYKTWLFIKTDNLVLRTVTMEEYHTYKLLIKRCLTYDNWK